MSSRWLPALALAMALPLAACGGSVVGEVKAASPDRSATTGSPSESASPTDSPTSTGVTGGVTGDPGDPCALLSPAVIAEVTGTSVGDGSGSTDAARQSSVCTWRGNDPLLIVATGLTSVDGAQAYDLNKTIAPGMFDGDPVDTTVTGAEKAYLVRAGDYGWVVGALADGRYVSVQLSGAGDKADVVALSERAIASLG